MTDLIHELLAQGYGLGRGIRAQQELEDFLLVLGSKSFEQWAKQEIEGLKNNEDIAAQLHRQRLHDTIDNQFEYSTPTGFVQWAKSLNLGENF